MSKRARAIAAIVAMTIGWLVAIDVVVGRIAAYPTDPRQRPTELQSYFEYGRSLEGKLDRLLGPGPADEAPILDAGWIDRECRVRPRSASGGLGITLYGMSFTNHVGAALAALDPSLAITLYSAPSTTVGHSYACFRRVEQATREAGRAPDPVVVLGVLASNVVHTPTMTGLTTAFEAPTPYTYPRYRVASDGSLDATEPLITSVEQWRDPALRARFLAQLSRDDRYADPFLVGFRFADHSVLLRMARRAYAQHVAAHWQAEMTGDGSKALRDPDVGPVLVALLADFAARAKADGQMPVVLLIQDRPGVDTLERMLAPSLVARGIPFVSTRTVVPTTDPANFTGDGHFTEAGDRRVAERLLATIAASRRGQAAR